MTENQRKFKALWLDIGRAPGELATLKSNPAQFRYKEVQEAFEMFVHGMEQKEHDLAEVEAKADKQAQAEAVLRFAARLLVRCRLDVIDWAKEEAEALFPSRENGVIGTVEEAQP